MNLKRAILFGCLLWILIFFEVSILMFGLKLKVGLNYYLVHYFLAIVLTALVAMFYFKKQKASAVEGLKAGVMFLVVGAILDAVITVPLFVKTYSFYTDIYLWIGFILGILTTVTFGALIRKPKKK